MVHGSGQTPGCPGEEIAEDCHSVLLRRGGSRRVLADIVLPLIGCAFCASIWWNLNGVAKDRRWGLVRDRPCVSRGGDAALPEGAKTNRFHGVLKPACTATRREAVRRASARNAPAGLMQSHSWRSFKMLDSGDQGLYGSAACSNLPQSNVRDNRGIHAFAVMWRSVQCARCSMVAVVLLLGT